MSFRRRCFFIVVGAVHYIIAQIFSQPSQLFLQIYLLTEEIIIAAEGHTKKILAMAQGMSTAYTVHALSSSSSQNWPFIRLPYFEVQGNEARAHSDAKMMAYAPLVKPSEKESWEEYVEMELKNTTDMVHPIHSLADMDDHEGHGHVGDGDGHNHEREFFVPLWQMDPANEGGHHVNLDLATYHPIKKLIERVLETREPALSELLDLEFLDEFINTADHDGHGVHDDDGFHPHAMMIYPVFDSFADRLQSNNVGGLGHEPTTIPVIKGFVFAIFPWEVIFMNDEMIRGMYAVLTDTCGDNTMYTYYMSESKVTLIGRGAQHESRFNEFGRHTELELEIGGVEGEGHSEHSSHEGEGEAEEEHHHHEHVRYFQHSHSHALHEGGDENCVVSLLDDIDTHTHTHTHTHIWWWKTVGSLTPIHFAYLPSSTLYFTVSY